MSRRRYQIYSKVSDDKVNGSRVEGPGVSLKILNIKIKKE